MKKSTKISAYVKQMIKLKRVEGELEITSDENEKQNNSTITDFEAERILEVEGKN